MFFFSSENREIELIREQLHAMSQETKQMKEEIERDRARIEDIKQKV